MVRWRLGLVLCLVALGMMFSAVTTGAAPRPDQYTLPGDAVFPEGVAFEEATGYFFVSSTTDGTIFRGHVQQPEMEVFLPGGEHGRTTAIGLAVDANHRLFVAGGGTGRVYVYDTRSGALLAALQATNPSAGSTFINDVVVTRSGDAFATDSMVPILFRVTQDDSGAYVVEEWLHLGGTAINYQAGFNLNGIVVTANDQYLIAVQSNVGKLFRIDIATRDVVEIDLAGVALTAGDGLVLRGHTLYVVRNALGEIAVVRLSGDWTTGRIVDTITDSSFRFPTTADIARGRLLVVNSQFNQRGGQPELPFTVSSIKMNGK